MSDINPAWTDLWAEAKARPIMDVVEALGVKLKKSGVDFVGNCPAGCTKNGDGFIITPKKGIFLCRPSGATGDNIDLVMHAKGMTKNEALEFVTGRDLPGARAETDEERAERERRNARLKADADRRRVEAEREEAKKRERDDEAIASVLLRAGSIQGTHAEAYLCARGITPHRRLTGDLRFVAVLDYWGVKSDADDSMVLLATLPAMVAIIRDVAGEIIGIHQTYLDPREPAKWKPTGGKKNAAKKVRGEQHGGLIRLGMVGDKLAIGEGIETTLAWHQLGYGPEDITLAAGVNKGNMSGAWTGTFDHPVQKNRAGRPTKYPNGVPDMERPGMILPDDVREVILLGDGDSEPLATMGAMITACTRFENQGRVVSCHWAPPGEDWGDVNKRLRAEMERAG